MKILYLLAKRFIAGHNFDSAKPEINRLLDKGYEVSIDYLGELSKTKNDCIRARRQYLEIIKFYAKGKHIDISIKPSQLGLLINPVLAFENLNLLAKEARLRGHTIRLDMEDSRVTELTRNLAISLNKKHHNVGVAIQSNLYRSNKDLKILIKENVSVRIVKGAYKEDSKIATQNKEDIKFNFFNYIAELRAHGGKNPAVATHDEELLEDITEMMPNPDYFHYEFLYGIRRDLQRKFKENGYKVRIYVPFGEDWLPYVLRRLKEWKNLIFVIKNIFKEWCK